MKPGSLAARFVLLGALVVAQACSQVPVPPPPPQPPLEYLGEWGPRGEGPGKISFPLRLARDHSGLIYVADGGTGFIHKFNPQGKPLLSFTDHRLEKARIARGDPAPSAPAPNFAFGGLAVDRGGAVYLTLLTPPPGRVLIYLPDGAFFRELRAGAGKPFQDPAAVAVDDDGNIYVAELAGRVRKFNFRRRFVKAWGKKGGGRGEFQSPLALAIGPDQQVYVFDAGNARVQKFTRQGELVAVFHLPEGTPRAPARLAGLGFDRERLVVAEASTHQALVWTLDGTLLHAVDLEGLLGSPEKAGEGSTVPGGLAPVAPGELLVLDPAGARVLRFRIHF